MFQWNFKYFFSRINPYGLVEILAVIVLQIVDKTEAIAFLEKTKEKVKICDEAVWLCRVLQGQNYLEHLNNLEETKKIIEDLKEILEDAGNVTPVHGKYYMLASQYYRYVFLNSCFSFEVYEITIYLFYSLVGQHSDYYRCGLQFLGCSMDEYPKEEWPQHAFFLGLAALLGDGIYNIGELVSEYDKFSVL